MTYQVPTTLASPIPQNSSTFNDLIQCLNDTPTDEPPPEGKRRKFVHLASAQFTMLLQCLHQQQRDISNILSKSASSLTPTLSGPPSGSRPTDYYNNAKYEDIICHPMKPLYDVSINDLVPFLNCLDIQRHDETWSSVTHLLHEGKQLDLIRGFEKIPSSAIITIAKQRWESRMVDMEKCTFSVQNGTAHYSYWC